MITGSALRSVFAAMMAPRKLQSLSATVQAVAPAVSSVRSTSNVDVNGESVADREDALSVNFRDTPTKTIRVNTDQMIFLFIDMLQPAVFIGELILFGSSEESVAILAMWSK